MPPKASLTKLNKTDGRRPRLPPTTRKEAQNGMRAPEEELEGLSQPRSAASPARGGNLGVTPASPGPPKPAGSDLLPAQPVAPPVQPPQNAGYQMFYPALPTQGYGGQYAAVWGQPPPAYQGAGYPMAYYPPPLQSQTPGPPTSQLGGEHGSQEFPSRPGPNPQVAPQPQGQAAYASHQPPPPPPPSQLQPGHMASQPHGQSAPVPGELQAAAYLPATAASGPPPFHPGGGCWVYIPAAAGPPPHWPLPHPASAPPPQPSTPTLQSAEGSQTSADAPPAAGPCKATADSGSRTRDAPPAPQQVLQANGASISSGSTPPAPKRPQVIKLSHTPPVPLLSERQQQPHPHCHQQQQQKQPHQQQQHQQQQQPRQQHLEYGWQPQRIAQPLQYSMREPTAIPKANRLPDPPLEKFFGALRKEYPKMTDCLLGMVAPTLILRDPTTHQPRGIARAPRSVCQCRNMSVTWVWQIASALEGNQEWTHEVVKEVLTIAKQAYLSGERLSKYGGDVIENETGGGRRQLPTISEIEAEAAIQELLARPELARPAPGVALPVLPTKAQVRSGKRVDLPKAAWEMLEGGGLAELHKRALQDLAALLGDNADLLASKDIDFGVVHITPPAPVQAYGSMIMEHSLPEVVTAISGREEAWELVTSPGKGTQQSRIWLRDIGVVAGKAPVTVVDVRAYPELPSTFALVDDHGICREIHVQPTKDSPAVRLAPGEQFSATLLLDTMDGAHRQAECGLMQQLLLVTVVLDDYTAAPFPACRTLLKDKKAAVIIGCRVSVALTRQAKALQSLLNFEAKPFITERLLTLFDQPPHRYWAEAPPLKRMFHSRKMLDSVCWWLKNSAEPLKPPPPAYKSLGASQDLRKVAKSQETNLGSGHAKQSVQISQVRKYARLLQLEEIAMEDQIRRHDLFNIRYHFAVFEPGAKPQYRLHDMLPNARTDFDSPPLSKLGKKTYRGPQLSRLFPPDMTGNGCPRQLLLVLEVPGLPEDRPSLVFGDTLYIRFALADQAEFAGFVIATESTRCMVAMSKEFYTCCGPTPSKDDAAANHVGRCEQLLGISPDQAGPKDLRLIHVRFGFDRTRMQRMHAALAVAGGSKHFHMLPPELPAQAAGGTTEAGLPSQDEFLAAAQGTAAAPQPARPTSAAVPTCSAVRKTAEAIQEVGAQQLNAGQRWAVASFLDGAGGSCPYTLFGPPGTGKTVTLVECALQVVKKEPDARLLLCAPQGYSADLLASALGAAGVTRDDLLRIADPRHPPLQMKEDVLLSFSAFDDQLRAFELPEPAVVAAKRIIVMTCGAAGILRCGAYKQYHNTCTTGQAPDDTRLCGLEFSHVLIDEAGQALLPEAIVPLTLLHPTAGKALLCGDPKQLGPVVRSLQAAAGADGHGHGLAVSLLERFTEYNSVQAPARRQKGLAPATGTLVQNYRSHSSLLHIPNKLFYNQTLVAAADQSQLLPPAWSELELTDASRTDRQSSTQPREEDAGAPASAADEMVEDMAGLCLESGKEEGDDAASIDSLENGKAADVDRGADGGDWDADAQENVEPNLPSTLFFGVRGEQMREGEAPSYFNPIEAATLVELLEGLLKQHQTKAGQPAVVQDDIGVIATYRKQVQKIRLLLRARGLGNIRVGTVDDLQGQEERIIFISTVLSKPETLPAVSSDLGFWRNPKRFNVAITRAKALLVVLGHPVLLLEDPCWRELLRFCASRGAYKGAGSYAITQLVRSEGLSSLEYPGLTEALRHRQPGEEHDRDMAAAVGQIAEMALLGAGHAPQMFPETLEETYAAYGDEVQWRVAL